MFQMMGDATGKLEFIKNIKLFKGFTNLSLVPVFMHILNSVRTLLLVNPLNSLQELSDLNPAIVRRLLLINVQ